MAKSRSVRTSAAAPGSPAEAREKAARRGGGKPAAARGAAAAPAAPATDAEAAPFDAENGAGETAGAAKSRGRAANGEGGAGKQLVIVESPAKAKTINKYLGSDFVVLPSVGHVRDLPTKGKKGDKSPVPGVDLDRDFAPTYEILDGKGKVIGDLKRTARTARQVWFATDPDREGEAIAWHIAAELGIAPETAKRVQFNAITKAEIEKAFKSPAPINTDRVNAQQARRILDRIVGYQVSPLLWKKVARGLSAGRVQSVAVKLVVEREREIRAHVPDESWEIRGQFTSGTKAAAELSRALAAKLAERDAKGEGPTRKALAAWLAEKGCFEGTLTEVRDGRGEFEKFDLSQPGKTNATMKDLSARAAAVAAAAGLRNVKTELREDASGKGPARFVRTVRGEIDPAAGYRVVGLETKRTSTRPPPPFITSTLQQAGVNRLGMSARRVMGAAQQLYQGVDIPGEGPVALITYMRTDSTHLSGDALSMVRGYVGEKFGEKYLPEKPNFYASSNKDAQEAHEAIRPTSMNYPPARLKSSLKPELFRVYELIWNRFVACQMTPAQWDQAAATLESVPATGGAAGAGAAGSAGSMTVRFRATGRTLAFDGFYRVAGVPHAADEQTLPALSDGQAVAPVGMQARQVFSSPPPRYSEASLIKTLESEGIGRPSTYASIISVIQDRKYVENVERRFFATALGEAVTDKLVEAFPDLMDVGYTREMETKLDKIEEDHLDWVRMLHDFYSPFKLRLANVEQTLKHAKAETTPAPASITCPKCVAARAAKKLPPAGCVYRLGKSGRFLSCATYPECDYACPVDREGNPQPIEQTDVACPKCGSPMTRRTGRFGPFLGCSRYGDKANPCDGILNFDKNGRVQAPSPPPFSPEPPLPCPKCQSAMYLRPGKFGPWLGCSKFPKCRGRGNFKGVDEKTKASLEKSMAAWQAAHPAPIIKTGAGVALTDAAGKPLPTAPRLDGKEAESMEVVADDMGL